MPFFPMFMAFGSSSIQILASQTSEKNERNKSSSPTHQSRHVPLELSVGGAPLEHDVDVAEAGEGGLPGDVLRLLVQVGRRAQGQLVIQVASSCQV